MAGTESSEPVQAVASEPTPAEQLAAQYDITDDDAPLGGAGRDAPVQAEASAPAPAAHPRWLREQAEDFGFSQAEIDGMDTDQLGQAVRYAARAEKKWWQEQRPQAAPAAPQAPPQVPQEEEVDLGIPPQDLQDFDPRLVGALKTIASGYQKKTRALEERLQAAEKLTQQQQVDRTVSEIDQGFADLADDCPLLGKGNCADFKTTDHSYLLRDAVVKSVAASWPKGAPGWRKAVALRAREMFGAGSGQSAPTDLPPEPPTPRQQQAAERPREANGRFTREQWEQAALNRPTQRKGAAEPPGRDKATRAVTERIREMDAQQGDVSDDSFNDSFPG